MRYHAFIKSFETNVEKWCKDPDAKLARLLQYTDGDAHDSIRSSLLTGGESGYKQALDMLKDLYGSKHRVTQDVIETLHKSKPVKSAHDMLVLSHELRNSLHILQSIDSLAEANAHVIIFDIVSRLPNFVQNKWTKKE